MKQKTHDHGTPDQGKPESASDGVLKDLAAKAKTLAPVLSSATDGDPRRRGEITFNTGRNGPSDYKQFLMINGVMWAEVQWSSQRKAWCIQDACGYCLSHIEHMHHTVPNDGVGNPQKGSDLDSTSAIEYAKGMIRDGRMPSPEQARAEFLKRTGTAYSR